MTYRGIDKMIDLLNHEHSAMHILSRFGVPLGVAEKTIDNVCDENGIHTPTFLAIVNRQVSAQIPNPSDIDLSTLQTYLKNTHLYFLQFRLPRLRQQLIEAVNPADTNSRVPMLILRYFDEYVQEIRIHMQHEDEGQLEAHAIDDTHISLKLGELTNLIIKYYPQPDDIPFAKDMLVSVLDGLYQTEQELCVHCAIEDDILRPVLALQAAKHKKANEHPATEELSEREKDVVVQLVRGLSNKEIADALCISTHTVISHRKNITRKLNIHSVAGLTIYAIVNHLVDINSL